jgi:hypothetical protein
MSMFLRVFAQDLSGINVVRVSVRYKEIVKYAQKCIFDFFGSGWGFFAVRIQKVQDGDHGEDFHGHDPHPGRG